MTWTNIIGTGRGSVRARLAIEGFPVEFVTHSDMAGASFTDSSNLLPAAGAVTWTATGGATVTTGQTDPLGGTDAVLLADADAVARSADSDAATYLSGTAVLGEIWVKKDAAATTFVAFQIRFDGVANTDDIAFRQDTGEAQVTIGTIAVSDVTEAVSGWWRVQWTHSGRAATSIIYRFYPARGTVGSFPTGSAATTGSATVYAPSIKSSYGRTRIDGLSMRGVKLSQKADLVRATVEAEGATFVVADIDGAATAAFSTDPTATTWLTADVTAAATAMSVKSCAAFPTSGTLYIDSEAIAYGAKGTTTFTGLTRGIWSTLAQSHYSTGGAISRYPEVTNEPTVIEGRRVRLYIYGRGDDPRGDGTQIWLGVLRSEPRMEGPAWSFSVDPISSLLEQEVGADLDSPVTPRGIYIPFDVEIGIYRNAWSSGTFTFNPDPGSGLVSNYIVARAPAGFYETQDDFLADLNTDIAASTSAWNATITAEAFGGGYRFKVVSNSTPDGITIMSLLRPDSEPLFDGINAQRTSYEYDPSTFVTGMDSNSTRYFLPNPAGAMDGAGLVPRGAFKRLQHTRVYLGGTVGVTARLTAALVEWQNGGSEEREYAVSNYSATDRWIELSSESPPSGPPATLYYFTPSNLPTIRLGRAYNDYADTGTYSLLKTIEDDCAAELNTGGVPSWRSGDWDSAAWLTAYGSTSAIGAQRRYSSLKPVKLTDFVSPDLQIAGLYLGFDTSGRLTVNRLRLAAATEVTTANITAANLLTDDGFPTYERSAVGQFNTLELHEGYDAKSDEYMHPTISVRDVAAYGRSPVARTIKIEPKSAYAAEVVPFDQVVALASQVLGVFGGPYAYITCAVPLTFFNVTIGSTVSITTAHLPASTGTRGVSAIVGLVTAREIDLYGGRITLTILVSRANISGYAFGAKVSSQTNTAGNTWEITVTSTYFATGEDASDHVAAGDPVQVYRYDSATAGTVDGTVDSVSGNVVTVTFGTAWTPGSDEWAISLLDADGGAETSNTRRYAYIAASSGVIEWTETAQQSARVFAP